MPTDEDLQKMEIIAKRLMDHLQDFSQTLKEGDEEWKYILMATLERWKNHVEGMVKAIIEPIQTATQEAQVANQLLNRELSNGKNQGDEAKRAKQEAEQARIEAEKARREAEQEKKEIEQARKEEGLAIQENLLAIQRKDSESITKLNSATQTLKEAMATMQSCTQQKAELSIQIRELMEKDEKLTTKASRLSDDQCKLQGKLEVLNLHKKIQGKKDADQKRKDEKQERRHAEQEARNAKQDEREREHARVCGDFDAWSKKQRDRLQKERASSEASMQSVIALTDQAMQHGEEWTSSLVLLTRKASKRDLKQPSKLKT